MRGVLVTIIAAAGCWGTPAPQEPIARPVDPPVTTARTFPSRKPPPPRCVTAVDHALEVARPELEQIPQMKERIELIREAVVASCQAVQWSDDSLACFENAGDMAEMRNCQAMLTSDQNTDLGKRMTDVLTKPMP
jgi:hypothetical protein